jgi:predicted acetyltransferase
VIIREADADDLDAAWRVRRAAFGGSGDRPAAWPGVASEERRFVADDGGRLCGFLRVRRFRQFFGGRVVPMGGLASVAVDPYARGKGVASGLLDASLEAMRADGQAVSALFTTVPALYRGRGWERAGVVERAEVPIDALRGVAAQRGDVSLGPIDKASLDHVHACYLAVAAELDGMLDRSGPAFGLDGLLERDLFTVARTGGELSGYLDAERIAGRDGVLDVHTLLARDHDSAAALLRSLGSWAGLMHTVRFRLADPAVLALLLPGALGGGTTVEPWYLRVVDLPAAVSARGWPAARFLADGTTAEIEVVDEHATWHAGRHRLVVAEGSVRCEAGGNGTPVRLHARALGPWFSGAASTGALRRAGLLDGDALNAGMLDTLTAAHGPARMLDTF